MAERGGFEPPARVLPVQLLSRQPCSATPAPLRGRPSHGAEAQPFRHMGMPTSPQFAAFSLEQQDKKWPADESRDHSDRDFSGSEERARERVADHEES